MANQNNSSPSPFGVPSAFVSGDPNQAAYLNGVQMVIIKVGEEDGATLDQINSFKTAHPDVQIGIWQSGANQEGVDIANQLNAPYIAQAESPDQLSTAVALSLQINGPKALVTPVTGVIGPGQWPPGWSGLIETYQNENTTATPENMVFAATQAGASDITLVLGAYGDGASGAKSVPLTDYLAELSRLGITNFSVFSLNQLSESDRQAFQAWVAQYPAANTQTPPLSPSPEPPPAAAPSPNQQSDQPQENNGHSRLPNIGQGIDGPHQEAGTAGAPPAYTGGAPVVDDPNNTNDTFSFTDNKGRRVTITTTASGAKVEQVEGQTPYQIKAPVHPSESNPVAFSESDHQTPLADNNSSLGAALNNTSDESSSGPVVTGAVGGSSTPAAFVPHGGEDAIAHVKRNDKTGVTTTTLTNGKIITQKDGHTPYVSFDPSKHGGGGGSSPSPSPPPVPAAPAPEQHPTVAPTLTAPASVNHDLGSYREELQPFNPANAVDQHPHRFLE